MEKKIIWKAGLILLLLSSQLSYGQSMGAVKKEIIKTNSLYFELFKKKDLAIVSLYTDNGWLLPPNAPAVKGKAALIKDFTSAYTDASIQSVKFTTIQVYGDGSGYTTEEGIWQVFNTQGVIIDQGNYIKLWKKTGKAWRIYRDIFSSDHKSATM
ncbi:YybH family protein [Mucilaginibacter sp.]|uniref:YybH family protein n=1 Tax=Mucilaginibacter sp. TaxID=1882438 RepID=UPI0035BC65BB